MNLKSVFTYTLGRRNAPPLPVLVVPGVSLIALGLLVWLIPQLFIAIISGSLILLGSFCLLLAWKVRPRKPRIRVVEDE